MDTGRTDRLHGYWIWVTDALPIGFPVRESREGLAQVADLSAAEREYLGDLDAVLLEESVAGEVLPEVLEDDPAQPLERWWWHLGALHEGTYPVDLLPEPLRTVYREARAARPTAA